jgi:AcrR family transcriptional regulator
MRASTAAAGAEVPAVQRADPEGRMPGRTVARRARAKSSAVNPPREPGVRDERRSIRQQEIEAAAYAVLEEKGYAGASMLAIASRARASNETLYAWYGDKQGLFKALVTRNAAEVKVLLEAELGAHDPMATLGLLGPRLLALLTGPRAVALNRAAAADPSGELGAAISQAGRETVLPLIEAVLERARRRGRLDFERPADVAGLYLDLLIGDLQIRRVIGRAPVPTPAVRAERARLAVERLGRLLVPGADEAGA